MNVWIPRNWRAFCGKRQKYREPLPLCGSGNSEYTVCHAVSAWVAEYQITPGQLETEEKSNEIAVIPEIIDMPDIEGSTVTVDAMGCQKQIAGKIQEKGADYVLGLKANQPSLLSDVRLYFESERPKTGVQTLEKDHGRIEQREYCHCVAGTA